MLLKMNIQLFARNKNAKRQHFIAEYVPGKETAPTTELEWKRLAKYISSIGDVLNDGTSTFSPPSAKPTLYVPDGTSVFGSIPVISRGLGLAGTMTSSPL